MPFVDKNDKAEITPEQIILDKDFQNKQMEEAEIQKRLTKAVPFFRGKLCKALGLRYAPEIRFFVDTSLKQIK